MRRTLRKITVWRATALELYFRLSGRRCLRCSKPVETKDAELYRMLPGGDLLLVHRRCKP